MRQAKEASAEPRRGYEVTCRLVQQFNFLSIHVRSLHGVLTPDKGRANAFQLQHLYVGISTSLREVKVPGPAANFSIGSDSPWQDWLVLTLVLLGGVFISAVVPVRHDEDGNDHREGPEQSFVAAVLAAAGPPSACHGSKREAGNMSA